MLKYYLLLLLLLPILLVPIFAAESVDNPSVEITVTTDKSFYLVDENIIISGEVSSLYSGIVVSVIVTAPNGNIVSIVQLEVNDDKTFSIEHSLGGSLMKGAGAYTITAQYGDNKNNSATTSFDFGGVIEKPVVIIPEPQQQLILKQKQLNDITHQITIFENKINRIQNHIDSQQVRLDEVISNNATQRIEKFTSNIESLTALQNIYQSLWDTAQNQLELYS